MISKTIHWKKKKKEQQIELHDSWPYSSLGIVIGKASNWSRNATISMCITSSTFFLGKILQEDSCFCLWNMLKVGSIARTCTVPFFIAGQIRVTIGHNGTSHHLSVNRFSLPNYIRCLLHATRNEERALLFLIISKTKSLFLEFVGDIMTR